MSFDRWLKLYQNSSFSETKISLLSYLEQGNVIAVKQVERDVAHYDIINSIIGRVYSL